MKQKMSDIPKTKAEENRQRGPIPLTAVFLMIALAAAGAFFIVPALQSDSSQSTAPVWQDNDAN